jgi:pimeloyl-ACP methyl ester carboxylesterase/dienelactone hydrolase
MRSAGIRPRLVSALVAALLSAPELLGGGAPTAQTPGLTREEIVVPHVSTVPANAGQRVGIAVRHVTQKGPQPARGPVLFTNTGFTSSPTMFDLEFKTYSIAGALAEQGFDIYLMDQTGFGRSPRPTMDDPCNVDPSQQQLLIPSPLQAPCTPSYPRHLVTIFTELSEIDSIIDYIRKTTGRNRVSLAGWSRSLARFGVYAAEHPEKVERLAIVGPGYRRDAPSGFQIGNSLAAGPSRTSAPPFSFLLRSVDDIFAAWERQRRCDDIVDPGFHDAFVNAVRAYADPGAATWGTPAGRFYRVPNGTQVDAGWNQTSARRVKAPVLLVVGEHDPRFAEEAPNLFADIGSTEKILLKVQCATHFLLFERNHKTVHNAFAEFLTKGTVDGRQGVITADRNGNYLPASQTIIYTNNGERIEAQLYKPAGSGPFPLVMHVHSGPDTAEFGQILARVLGRAGYATMIATIRGAPFDPATRVEGLKRAAGDMLAAVDHFTRDSAFGIDAQRIAITGYSAGGSVAVLTAASSDRFRAVITEAPSSVNWSREPALREAVISAARRLRVPTLCLVAENDNTAESARSVCAAANDGGAPSNLIVYSKFIPERPSTNPEVAAGHMLFGREDGLEIWEKDVLAFLEKSLRTRQ